MIPFQVIILILVLILFPITHPGLVKPIRPDHLIFKVLQDRLIYLGRLFQLEVLPT